MQETNKEINEIGYHEDGVGYNPLGHWCGECSENTCEHCSEWLKIKQENPDWAAISR